MIITNNEEALRIKCFDVLENEAYDIIQTLENELSYANKNSNFGIGLAAPQIGIAKKAAIIRVSNYKINLINANIEKKLDLKTFENEGCLSFPGRIETTNRYQEITIVNNLFHPNKFVATDLLAVAIQHEIDHYNQIIFTDHIIKNKKLRPNDICNCGSHLKFKKCCGK